MKKNIILSLLFMLLAAHIFSSCNKECQEKVLVSKSLEALYGCHDTRNTLSIDLTNSAVIISSQADYESRIEGPCSPAIDFVNYDLIIGTRTTTQVVDTILYDYRIACPSGNKTLVVDIMLGSTVQADDPVFHQLVQSLAMVKLSP